MRSRRHKHSVEKDSNNFKIFLTDEIGKVNEEAAEANKAHLESTKSRMMEKVSNFDKPSRLQHVLVILLRLQFVLKLTRVKILIYQYK